MFNNWTASCKRHVFRSSCACANYHLGICSPFIHSLVSHKSATGQRRPWLDCADVLVWAFSVHVCPCMPYVAVGVVHMLTHIDFGLLCFNSSFSFRSIKKALLVEIGVLLRYLLHFCCISWRIYNLLEKVQHWKMIHQTRFNLKQESSSVYVFLFGFNVAFNNFSVILQWCLGVTGRSILTLRVLPLWNIPPRHMT